MSKRSLLALACASLGLVALTAQSAPTSIEVMTQNQYVGADLFRLVGTPDFNSNVIDVLELRAASLPAERVQALAALIAQRMPALVAVEEAYKFTCTDATPGDQTGCEDPAIAGAFTDQLAGTLSALGGKYYAAAHVRNLDIAFPIVFKSQLLTVTALDRDVILARADVPTAKLPFKDFCLRPSISSDGCNYAFVASTKITIGGQEIPVNIERGFVGVTAMINKEPYHFIATHLETRLTETEGRIYQSGQAAELLGYLTPLVQSGVKTLVGGDFNSDPRNPVLTFSPEFLAYLSSQGVPDELLPYLGIPPYQLMSSLFTDVWTLRPGASTGKGAPLVGMSCCQDEDLGNRKSVLYERVDLLWSSVAPTKVQDARLLGESISNKTKPIAMGVWPSDHAAVAAKLTFGK
jgi:hypothetical protein